MKNQQLNGEIEMNDELNLPWKIYFFNEDGKYDPKEVINVYRKEDMFKTSIRESMRFHNGHKLEIRVCDCLDYCIMHWKDGKKVFPK